MHQDKVKRAPNLMGRVCKDGALAIWPVCLGYLPIGLAFGVLAGQAGMAPWTSALMSLVVFAGSSQFIGVAILGQGASLAAIVATVFVVNLRHALMSSALAVHLADQNRFFLALFAFGITDESFAVNIARFHSPGWDRWRALAVNIISYAAWVGASALGGLAGQCIPVGALGTDYALPAMFICLLVTQLKSRILITAAVLAGAAATLWRFLVPGNSYIVAGALGGATLAFFIKRVWERGR